MAVHTRFHEGPAIVSYESLRDDWVKGADLVTRLIYQSAGDGRILSGFPRQWIPLFVHFGARWQASTPPLTYVCLASDLNDSQLIDICSRAHQEGLLRTLVEAFASLDPLIADVLYKLDRRYGANDSSPGQLLPLTGWQSYGRPEVLALNRHIAASARARANVAVLLPCARKRPYEHSKTHRRIWRRLNSEGINESAVDKIVVSSIGIVPQDYWRHPVVQSYDSGVPDIYRILRLMRIFFARAQYEMVIDCLEFAPYSDCLEIVSREGLVGNVQVVQSGRRKTLPQP
ncbi:MAG: DUF5591 domain-containing protein [Gallionellaceae bacterium]